MNEVEREAERLLLERGVRHSIMDCEVQKDETINASVYNRARERPG